MNRGNDFTFLTEKEVFDLDILKKYGTKCAITDFAILLGGVASNYNYVNKCNTRKNRTWLWWTKSSYKTDNYYNVGSVRVIHVDGKKNCYNANSRYGGARPTIPYSSIKSVCSSRVKILSRIKEVLYGEYPQTVASNKYYYELEKAYGNDSLNKTGKKYTTDSVDCNDEKTNFKPKEYIEYEYKGKKYIRFVAELNCDGKILSNGRTIKAGEVYWIRVEPITWLVDKKADIALSKNILFAGVQFDNNIHYNGNFEKTNIKKFMDKYFSREIEMENQKKLSNKETNNVQGILDKVKKSAKPSNNEKSEQAKLEELKNLKKKIKQLDEKIKPLQELKKTIVSQLHNQKVNTNDEKKKHKYLK